ncbi:MAG: hypothetical protein JRN52_11265 [Nitrososphaerota archaeon]|nr:hypothetical protein [Nitrososphaerota archaeon]
MSTLEIVSENENKLLSRKELVCSFALGSGLITRQAAAEAIATRLGVKKDGVKIVSLSSKFGSRDLLAKAYVYSDLKLVDVQLPKYMKIRQLSKEERKQAKEAAKQKAAPAAEKKA